MNIVTFGLPAVPVPSSCCPSQGDPVVSSPGWKHTCLCLSCLFWYALYSKSTKSLFFKCCSFKYNECNECVPIGTLSVESCFCWHHFLPCLMSPIGLWFVLHINIPNNHRCERLLFFNVWPLRGDLERHLDNGWHWSGRSPRRLARVASKGHPILGFRAPGDCGVWFWPEVTGAGD